MSKAHLRSKTRGTHRGLYDFAQLASTRLDDCLQVLEGLFSLGIHTALDLVMRSYF